MRVEASWQPKSGTLKHHKCVCMCVHLCNSMEQMPWVLGLKTWTVTLNSSGYEKSHRERWNSLIIQFTQSKY